MKVLQRKGAASSNLVANTAEVTCLPSYCWIIWTDIPMFRGNLEYPNSTSYTLGPQFSVETG